MKFIYSLFVFIICFYASGAPNDWQILRISNHPKARGLDFSIKHPSSWIVKEGNRPHVVKKLSNGNKVFVILVRKFPMPVSQEEADDMFSQEDIKKMIPHGALLISCEKTKLERQTAWLYIYSLRKERLGFKFMTVTTTCILIYRNNLLQMQNMCAFPPDTEFTSIKSDPVLLEKYKTFILESLKVFNTLVIHSEYQ